VLVVPNNLGAQSVGLVLGPDDVFLTAEGTPTPGIALSPDVAHEVARSLIEAANEIQGNAR